MDAYFRGVAHDQVQDVGHRHGDLTARYDRVPGAGTPQPPGSERFWVASSSGVGTQTLQWKPRSGRWSVVVMRADAARGVAADVKVGVRLNLLLWIGIGSSPPVCSPPAPPRVSWWSEGAPAPETPAR